MIDASLPARHKAEILKLREERRRVFLRIIPIFAKKDGERREYGLGRSAHSDVRGVAGRLSDGGERKSLYYGNWPVEGKKTQENGESLRLSTSGSW